MSEDMRQRPWRCVHCGQRVSSKSPGQRNIFPALKDMIVTALMANSLVRVVDDPARPAGIEMTPDYGRTTGTCEEAGKDLEIRVTVHNQRFPWTRDEPETPRQALERYLGLVRDMTPEQVGFYVCGILDDHEWTDEEKE